jgi:predicted acylesterase/phospholipase RssA
MCGEVVAGLPHRAAIGGAPDVRDGVPARFDRRSTVLQDQILRRGAAMIEPPTFAQEKTSDLPPGKRRPTDPGPPARESRQQRAAADIAEAERVLGGEAATLDAVVTLGERLAALGKLGQARRLLRRARLHPALDREARPDLYREVFQKSALYTYKDPDLPLKRRLDAALELLEQAEDLATTSSQETLGLAGSIHKRRWEADGLRAHLERALFFYLRGYALGIREEHLTGPSTPDALAAARADVIAFLRARPDCQLWAEEDRGYCGINAAFVLDLLAREEEQGAARAGFTSTVAEQRRLAARLIREEVIRSVPPLLARKELRLAERWWFYATVGEAFFGLGSVDESRYAQAIDWLVTRPRAAGLAWGAGREATVGLEVPEWAYESTARQLARLARAQQAPGLSEERFAETTAGQALGAFLGNDAKALESTFRGKFGLGLSGGGFRASLFHIGMLARLAELDVLRHVEVLSCVSGGSIIGAQYYLAVRHLLQTRTDDEITRQDYIDLVKRLEVDFLAGVQRNLRTRVLAEWTTNVRMMFSSSYTRTMRVGELYERELFSRVEDVADQDAGGKPVFRSPVTGPRWMPDWLARRRGHRREARFLDDLFIRPRLADGTQQTEFHPPSQNWRRRNKAPILVLNAAALNTGHTWQFTARYMGEPPSAIVTDIDCNYRLRRMYYEDAPAPYRKFRLGHAVAASSCVPGLFEPLILDGLYPDGAGGPEGPEAISVRLVDGGACDNQGVGSLLEQECSVMLVSDASGQMDAEDVPAAGVLGVLLRTNSVFQARVREAQYLDLASRQQASLLRGLMFIHLRQDLRGKDVAWTGIRPALKQSELERSLEAPADATSFEIAADVQRQLSQIRTDLDSFSDAEAFALMTSAYRMTCQRFDRCIDGFSPPPRAEDWRFLRIEAAMRPPSASPDGAGRSYLQRLLRAGASVAFKVWKISRPLAAAKWLLLLSALILVALLFEERWHESVVPGFAQRFTFKAAAVVGGTFLAFTILGLLLEGLVGQRGGKHLMWLARWPDTLRRLVIGTAMSLLGFALARLHLHVFDRLFLRHGRLDNFPRKKP